MATREEIVSQAKKWIGLNEYDGSHMDVINIYNSHKPLASGYSVKKNDAWCATFVSAVSIKCNATDIMPTECSCQRMIELYKKAGRWIENDAYTPQKGDVIFYDWDDSGIGDNVGHSDHVGIVAEVNGTSLKIIEGNMDNAVKYRNIKVNNRYIRGYGIPNYASKATSTSANKTSSSKVKVDVAKHFSESIAGAYKTTTGLNLRSGAGKTKKNVVLTVVSKGDTVNCYGYYNTFNGVKWYYVAYKNKKGETYLGYVSSKYLKK